MKSVIDVAEVLHRLGMRLEASKVNGEIPTKELKEVLGEALDLLKKVWEEDEPNILEQRLMKAELLKIVSKKRAKLIVALVKATTNEGDIDKDRAESLEEGIVTLGELEVRVSKL